MTRFAFRSSGYWWLAPSLTALLVSVFLGGCYSPTFPEGVLCAEGRLCPKDQVCAADNRCYSDAPDGEAGQQVELAGLELSEGVLEPAFSPDILSYRVGLGIAAESIELTATSEDPTSEIRIGQQMLTSGVEQALTLPFGKETIELVVQAGADSTTYEIEFDRGGDFAQQAFIKATNAEAQDNFGWVAVSGNTVAVGANAEAGGFAGVGGDQADNSRVLAGAVYVFARNDDGVWSQQAYIKSSNPGANDEFGRALALDGDTLVVGASSEDSDAVGVGVAGVANDNRPGSGAAYIFHRTGTNWSQQAFVKASNPDDSDRFGGSVAIFGDTVVVGASNEDSGASGVDGNQLDNSVGASGAAYVFERSGSTWSQRAYLKASNPHGAMFGTALAISGDTIAVGALGEDSNATGVNGNQTNRDASGSGAVYTFVRSGSTWVFEAYIKASNTDEFDGFGGAIALNGDDLVIGAGSEDSASSGIDGFQGDNSAENSGAVYLFRRNGGVWAQTSYIKSNRVNAGDVFGVYLSIEGNVLAIGAPGEASASSGIGGNQDDNSLADSGAAFLFARKGGFWSQELFIKASNPDGDLDPRHFGDGFAGVGLSGDTLVVGARGESSADTGVDANQQDNSAFRSGAIYIFR